MQFSGAWIRVSAMGDFDFIAGAYAKVCSNQGDMQGQGDARTSQFTNAREF